MLDTLRQAFARKRLNHQPRVPTPRLEAADDLPPHVRVDLDCAIVHLRGCETGRTRRVVVQVPGRQPWFDGADETRKALADAYPELNADQLEAATRYLRRFVRAHVRVAKRLARGPSWVNAWRGEV